MKTRSVFILLLCGTLSVKAQPAKKPVTQQPNILFISIDDLNDWINIGKWSGRKGMKTPNFERLAKMSMTFNNCGVAAPACAPSRVSIMTGVHPVRSGVTGWKHPEWRKVPALQNVVTIEQFFKARGYTTLGGGKIYHTQAPPRTFSNQSEPFGWDFYYPSIHVPVPFQIRAPNDVINIPTKTDIPQPDYFSWGPIPIEDKLMADYQTVEWANYVLSQKHDKPLFLAVEITKRHDPWEVPQKYFDMYPLDSIEDVNVREDDLNDTWVHGRRALDKFIRGNDQTRKVVQSYMATISFADAMLGRLLDGLERSRYKDNTIIIMWSDHGMHMGEKENWEKFTLWERSLRTPLMIRMPGTTRPGSLSDIPVGTIDLFPTLAEMIGEKPPAYCDGESLLPLIRNQTTTHRPVLSTYELKDSANQAHYDAYTLRTAEYRYIYYPSSGLEELYDHRVDDHEWYNIAYKPASKPIITSFRNLLVKQVPALTWNTQTPKGYEITKDGAIRKLDYRSIDQLKEKKWWF